MRKVPFGYSFLYSLPGILKEYVASSFSNLLITLSERPRALQDVDIKPQHCWSSGSTLESLFSRLDPFVNKNYPYRSKALLLFIVALLLLCGCYLQPKVTLTHRSEQHRVTSTWSSLPGPTFCRNCSHFADYLSW